MKETSHNRNDSDSTANHYVVLQKVNSRLDKNSQFNTYAEYMQFIESNLKRMKKQAISKQLKYYEQQKAMLEDGVLPVKKFKELLLKHYNRNIDYLDKN